MPTPDFWLGHGAGICKLGHLRGQEGPLRSASAS